MELRYPLNFASGRHTFWPEIIAGEAAKVSEDELAARHEGPTTAFNAWMNSTCVYFAKFGLPFTVSSRPKAGAINIVEARRFGVKDYNPAAFTAVFRGDAHRTQIADFSIEQNLTNVAPQNSGFMQIWVQPAIRPRAANRGDQISVLSYKGIKQNLDEGFRNGAFLEALARRGVDFEWDKYAHTGDVPYYCDYTTVDLTLSVRNMTYFDAARKPASKLVNSWAAGVPALLGPEPAFEELRRSEYDFLTVRSPEDALSAIDRLSAHPELYRKMREACAERAEANTVENLVKSRVALLNGDIAESYERWMQGSAAAKWLKFPFVALAERRARKIDRQKVLHGRRILDAPE